jgi:hypothetical protein
VAITRPQTPLESGPVGPPHRVYREESTVGLTFNVMPDRPVTETLYIHEYRVWPRYVEAEFDRTYQSRMRASPSHLIFLTALAHLQKMIYVALCHEFNLPYDPKGPERLKLWPTKIDVKIPVLIKQEEDLVHRVYIRQLKKRDDKTYKVVVESRVGSMQLNGEAPVFLMEE